MRYDPPLSYHVHRIALVVLFAVVALLFCVGVLLAAGPTWQSLVEMIDVARAQWRSW